MAEIMIEILNGLNNFFILFFQYMKYIFAFILIILGILTLLSLRKIYFTKKLIDKDVNEDFLRKCRLVIGSAYIIMGSGILFNYMTYFLILILTPLPDQFLQSFIIDSIIKNLNFEEEWILTLLEECFSSFFAIGSFYALLTLLLMLWYFFHNSILKNPQDALYWLISSIALGILCGFSTCLPYLL